MSNTLARKDIRMVDLKGQYERIRPEVDAAIAQVIESTQFINGDQVQLFSKDLEDYLGVKHVIPCANGTDALQVALMSLGIGPGDEVITSDFTFAATVEVIGLLGATPILVDVLPDTFNMDPVAVEKAITPRTKAIVPVHLFGQCADMQPILSMADDKGIAVVEDTAQAIGADYIFPDGRRAKAGTMGTIGTTSFFPSKNLGCYGDGGALFTNDDEIAGILRSIVNHGMSKRYYYDRIGVNSRLDTIQAAVLKVKLAHLDQYSAARVKAADLYDRLFGDEPRVTTPLRSSNSTHVFHQYTLKLHGQDHFQVQQKMAEAGVPAMIYYPVALHSQEAYQHPGIDQDAFPVTDTLCSKVLSLPMHTELDDEQIEYIVTTLKASLA